MKSEFANNFYPFYKIMSLNNNIDPTVDILIESIDRFSFGEESDGEKTFPKTGGEEKIKKTPPNNYGYIKAENILAESNQKLQNLNNLINKITEIKILSEDNNNKGKICGIFKKEDFEIKIDKKKNHKNNQLNDSFEKKYHNPLKGILDDEDDNFAETNKNNNINNLPILKKEENPDTKNNDDIEEKNIINDINNDINEINRINNGMDIDQKNEINNLNNSNSNLKINNYDADDDKENEHKIKEINNQDSEIPFIGNLLPYNKNEKEPISPINSQEIPKLNPSLENTGKKDNHDIDLPINKKEIDNNKINNNNLENKIENNIENKIENNSDNIYNDGYLSPRLGGNFVEEEKEQKEDIKKIKEKEKSEKKEDKNINKEKIINEDLNNNEKQMNMPLIINPDNNLLNQNSEKKENKNGSEKKIEKQKDLNMNLTELKENSFIIKNTSSKPNTINDSEEKNKKILELTQKLEKSEKDNEIIKQTNEKLLEVINMFKNLQTIEQKKTPNSGKNSRSDTPKRRIIKKRCFTPTLSKTNKLYNNAQPPKHKRSNSYNKIKINNQYNENRLYIDYIPAKQRTYRELHGKDSRKKEKKNNQINNNNAKSYGNYINRNTIYLTGIHSYKYLKSPYLNNNMNYRGISYSNGFSNFNKHNISYINNLYMNNSSQSFYANNNLNNNFDDSFKNIYQRQVMQMPPNEQPLFYETKSNMNQNNNNIYNELIYNNNINYNSENKFNRNNEMEKNSKYIQDMPLNYNNNSHDYNSKKNNNNKRNKNKLLDYKDFQIIFDEPSTKEKSDYKKNPKNDNINKNNLNNNNSKITNSMHQNNNYENINLNKNSPNNNNNNNYNLINYREYSNYKNEKNNTNKNEIVENKKTIEKYAKGNEDNGKKDKNLGYKTGIINNFNKNKAKTKKINNNKKNKNIFNEKEESFDNNNDKNNKSNELDDSTKMDDKIAQKLLEKNKGDFVFPFYLINRNEMFFNILSYMSNEKPKKKNK